MRQLRETVEHPFATQKIKGRSDSLVDESRHQNGLDEWATILLATWTSIQPPAVARGQVQKA